MRSNLRNALLYKVLKLVPRTATVPEIYVATTTAVIYNYYGDTEGSPKQLNSLKLRSYPGDNVAYCCAVILVDSESLESSGAFKPEYLRYINNIF